MNLIKARAADISNRKEEEAARKAEAEKLVIDNCIKVLKPAIETALKETLECISDERFEELLVEQKEKNDALLNIEIPIAAALQAKIWGYNPTALNLDERYNKICGLPWRKNVLQSITEELGCTLGREVVFLDEEGKTNPEKDLLFMYLYMNA